LRIAVNTRLLTSERLEGIGHYIDQLVWRLVQLMPEHDFHFFFDRTYDPRFIYADNVTAHVIQPPTRHPLLWYYWFEYQWPKRCRRLNIDLIFSPDGFCSTQTHIPTILTIHDLAYLAYPSGMKSRELSYYQKWIPKFIAKADMIICVSDFTKAEISHYFPAYEEKCLVIKNGVDENFKPIAISEQQLIREKYSSGQPYLLYMGSMHPRKNIKSIIEAFELFKTKNNTSIKLLLAGRMAWETTEIATKLKNSPFKKDIIHLPNFEKDRYQLVAAATALVYLSLYEGFGLPIIEAMSCRVPVIGSALGAMKETSGGKAILVNPLDTSQVADAMVKVFSSDDQLKNTVDQAYMHSQHYNWNLAAEKLKVIFENYA
jgi:glycosyltransferase involved in cell wall biosynthesis